MLSTLVPSKGKPNGDGSVLAVLSNALTADIGLSYRYLHRARAAFVGGAVDQLALVLGGPGGSFNLQALGDEHSPGLVALISAPRGGSATYLLTLGDDTAVGASASLASHTLTLNVSAVREPTTGALWLAGLNGPGRLHRRRAT